MTAFTAEPPATVTVVAGESSLGPSSSGPEITLGLADLQDAVRFSVDYASPSGPNIDLGLAVVAVPFSLAYDEPLPSDGVVLNETIQLGFTMHAGVEIYPSPEDGDNASGTAPQLTVAAAKQRRIVPIVATSYPEPVIVNGKPVVPQFLAHYGSDMTLHQGKGHIRFIPDPDPVAYDPNYEDPTDNPAPSTGRGDYRWTVRDLPDPADHGGSYWLGDRSAADGTLGLPDGCTQWQVHGGDAPRWHSVYPYKPSVRSHVYYGQDGSQVTETRAVRFNDFYIEHMWTDFGAFKQAPFSWVIVGIVMDFPTAHYEHTLLDTGRSPADGGHPGLDETQLAGTRRLHENIQGGARPHLKVRRTETRLSSDANSFPYVHNTFNHSNRPKMWAGVWNGDSSFLATYQRGKRYARNAKLPDTQQRYVVLGRESGFLARSHASHLAIFEMRFWDSGLTLADFDAQYKDLSSSWRFSEYH